MSTMQNFSTTAPRQCNTREHSWAEDFIDLSEFCQPSATPIKMEASVDEQYSSPVCNNTVRNHGFDYMVEGNESLENLDDNLWCMPSPIAMQEELCADPISDWLTSTKGHANGNIINNNNTINADCSSNILCDNPHPLPPTSTSTSHLTETSYDLNEQFLTSRLVTPVPNIVPQYERKPMEFAAIDDSLTPSPVQSDATFFHNEPVIVPLQATSTATTPSSFIDRVLGKRENAGNSGRNAAALFVENVLLNKRENVVRLPSMDALFKEKLSGGGGGGSSGNSVGSCIDFPTMLNQGERYLDDLEAVETRSSTVDRSSSSSSPSSSTADTKSSKKTVGGRQMTTSRGKDNETISTATSNSVDTPEMLQPLVDKNSDFDLVSYVFDDNKPSVSFDLSHIRASTLQSRSSKTDGGPSASRMVIGDKNESISIKTEPMDECSPTASKVDADTATKRGVKPEGIHQDKLVKKLRRYSTCSSEDLTQLESEKYRELRNKNNEASRRSRANRKSREVEMKNHAAKLEAENRRLKVKAEEMEKLVKRLRDCLMQLVLKRR